MQMRGILSSRNRLAAAAFLLSLFVYNANLRRIGTYDSLAASLIPFNLWEGRGLVLDRFASAFPPPFDVLLIRSPKGHLVSFYPIVTPLLATPLYLPWAAARLAHRGTDIVAVAPIFDKFAASILAAISVAILFLLLDRLTRRQNALILTVAYAFGTSTWVISSQALWQHGTAELLLALSLLLLLEEEPRPLRLAILGVIAGLLTANRPVDVVFSLAVAWLVIRRFRLRVAPFVLGSGTVAILWLAYNTTHFHSILGGYGDWHGAGGESLWMASNGLTGIAGLLASNRGLLAFSPFLLLFLAAPRKALKKFEGLGILLLACLAFLYLTARTPDWAGGYTFGPRLTTDALPVLIVALIGPLETLTWTPGRVLFQVGLVFSIASQAIGAFCFPGGDSGNENLGLWNLRNFSPVVAFRAGLRSPDFADLVLPALCLRERLPDDGLQVSYRWVDPQPSVWRARETKRIRIEIHNVGRIRWTSFGGRMGSGAVRLTGYWEGHANGPAYSGPLGDWWLARSVAPGESVSRSLFVPAPNISGPLRLCLELVQIGYARFSDRGVSPLCADISVLGGERKPKSALAVEWTGGLGPQELPQGSEDFFRVGARNLSNRSWPPTVSVAYHWVQFDGHNGNYNGVRTPVPRGERGDDFVWVDARVVADVPPGLYGLLFDLVEEGKAWASNVGSEPMMVVVRVLPPAKRPAPSPAASTESIRRRRG